MIKKKLNRSGIYIIQNKINGKRYVGSAKNLRKRTNKHLENLRNNCHENDYLQNAWNLYGGENFDFFCDWDYCIKSALTNIEQCWMDYFHSWDSKYGYNIRKIANSNLGVKHSKETIEKNRLSKAKKLNWLLASDIRKDWLTGEYTQEQLAKKYGVARGTINAVVNNYIWPDGNYINTRVPSERLVNEKIKKFVIKTKGRKQSQEEIEKRSISLRGKKRSEETKKRMSERQKELNSNSKINQKIADEIRVERAQGKTLNYLAKKHNVTVGLIWFVVHNLIWVNDNYEYVEIDMRDKLTLEQKMKIVKEYKEGNGTVSQSGVARKYGVSREHIRNILNAFGGI